MGKISNRIDRSRLRVKIQDMLVGEKAWISEYNLAILDTGQVWIFKDNDILRFFGAQPWPNHHKEGDLLIEKTDTDYKLHIFGDNNFNAKPSEEYDLENYVLIDCIEDHGPKTIPCPKCDGRGLIIEKKGI